MQNQRDLIFMPKMELMIETNIYLDVMYDAQVLLSTELKL
jgi:hypothetical protein